MFNAKVKCNYSNVDLNEVLSYGAKPSLPGDVLKEGVFKKSGHHKGAGKSSYSDQIRCFRLKNHFLYYYQGDSLPIVDKNVTGVIILVNVYISRGLMNAPTSTEHPFVLRISTDQATKPKVYELRSQEKSQRDNWYYALLKVVINPPTGTTIPPLALTNEMNILYSELLSQSYQANCMKISRTKGFVLCNKQYLDLTFDELHSKYMSKSTRTLEKLEGLEDPWITKEGSSNELKSSRNSSSISLCSTPSEGGSTSGHLSPYVKSKIELMEAVRKHTDYMRSVSTSTSNVSLQFI